MFRTIASQIAGRPSALSVGISRNRNRFFFSSGGRSRPRRGLFGEDALRPPHNGEKNPGPPPSPAPLYKKFEGENVFSLPRPPARGVKGPPPETPSRMS